MTEDLERLLKSRYAHWSSSMKLDFVHALKSLKIYTLPKKEVWLQIERQIEEKYFSGRL